METLPQILLNGFVAGGVYALLAVGYALVYGVLRLINFAHGVTFTVGAFCSLVLIDSARLSIFVVLPIVLLVGAASGVLIERLAYRPVRGAPLFVQIVTALSVTIIAENLFVILFGSDSQRISNVPRYVTQPFQIGSVHATAIQLCTIGLAVVLLVVVWLVIMKTNIGRSVRAVADNYETAMTSGVNVNRVIAFTFAAGSSLGALSGSILALDVGCDPFVGTTVGFKAFTACVIGGMRSLPGAIFGGFFIGITENLFAGYVSTEYRTALVMTTLVLVLLLRRGGLASEAQLREV